MLLGLVVLSQLPFAYRRYRLARLQKAIQQLESQRTVPQGESDFVDYQGVIHVHSALGGHSTGTFAELIAAARANQLDFVIMTEHPQAEFDTSAMTLSGMHAGILFVNGNEVATASGDRLLLIPGSANAASMSTQTTQEVIAQQKCGRPHLRSLSGGVSGLAIKFSRRRRGLQSLYECATVQRRSDVL